MSIDGDPSATVTVAVSSTIDVQLADVGTRGDAFALFLNGVEVLPTGGTLGPNTRGPSATAFFSAVFDNIPLMVGLNVFTITLTDSCCSAGGSSVQFGAVEPAASDVPLPASAVLLLSGLTALGFARRRV